MAGEFSLVCATHSIKKITKVKFKGINPAKTYKNGIKHYDIGETGDIRVKDEFEAGFEK